MTQHEINQQLQRMHRREAEAKRIREQTGTTIAHARALAS